MLLYEGEGKFLGLLQEMWSLFETFLGLKFGLKKVIFLAFLMKAKKSVRIFL